MAEVVGFPFARTISPLPNDPDMEFFFGVLAPHTPAAKKRFILLARQRGYIDNATTGILISALGLGEV